MLAITTGQYNYTEFNRTQCSFTFMPTVFTISLNITEKPITVSPTDQIPDDSQLPPHNVTTSAVRSVNLLSRMTPALYVSVLGDSLQRNREARQIYSPKPDTDSIALSSVEDFFASVVDDSLVSFRSSQLGIADDTQHSPTSTAIVKSVRIGNDIYILITLLVNTLFLLYLIEEAILTRFWGSLPVFDTSDAAELFTAAWRGGKSLPINLDESEDMEKDDLDKLRARFRVIRGLVDGEGEYAPTLIPV
ncbi:hypothetical protein N7451_012813 [Penicillium sp. IBT 35674x]|nr:hypothetical protein N7451_012813 [Penicillium sp. IBT 35674x]